MDCPFILWLFCFKGILWIVTTIRRGLIMEYLLLAKVGWVINTVIKLGYGVAGAYFVGTGVRYYKDYRQNVDKEKGVI